MFNFAIANWMWMCYALTNKTQKGDTKVIGRSFIAEYFYFSYYFYAKVFSVWLKS